MPRKPTGTHLPLLDVMGDRAWTPIELAKAVGRPEHVIAANLRGMRFRGEAVMLKPLPPSKSPRYRLK